MHTILLVAPSDDENVPDMQSAHTDIPTLIPYDPIGHGEHIDDPAVEYVPTPQTLQVEEPAMIE